MELSWNWTGYIVVGVLIFVFLVLPTWIRVSLKERKARRDQREAQETGRHEPPSIRPWVDPAKCMGSGACVTACPEKTVIAIINGRVDIVNGSSCVGHGACAAACPVNAIELGKYSPSLEVAFRIAAVFALGLEQVFSFEPES